MRIAISSGHFAPFHSGHLDYLKAAKELAGPNGQLWVIVNSDAQIERRGDPVLLCEQERLEIVKELRCVDLAWISRSQDNSVAVDLEDMICLLGEPCSIFWNPDISYKNTEFILCNGGDRTDANASSAESEICKKLDIEEVWGVGGTNKRNSSSRIREKIMQHIESERRKAECDRYANRKDFS